MRHIAADGQVRQDLEPWMCALQNGPGGYYRCTLPKDHDGEHEARVVDSTLMGGVWARGHGWTVPPVDATFKDYGEQ